MFPLLHNIAVLLMASFPFYIYAYPNGQVTSSCVTMTPEHGVLAQTSSPPFILSLDKYVYSPGDTIKVTLSSSSSTQFKGFLIQARSGSSTLPVGSFVTSNANIQTLTCTSSASSVSQTSSIGKSNVEVTWVAPMTNFPDIQIRATVVQTYSVFWTNVASAKITYVPISTASPSTTSSTMGNSSTTSSTVGNLSTTSTTIKKDLSTSTGRTSSNSGAQHSRILVGLLLSCGVMIAFLLV